MDYDELMASILIAQEQMIKANSVTLNGRKYGKLIENLPPNIKPTIFGMAVKVEYALPDDCDFLVQYEPPQPQTNADRIRAMSDEDLAEKIGESIDCQVCKTMHHSENDECPCRPHQTCADVWLDWLRQEVTK